MTDEGAPEGARKDEMEETRRQAGPIQGVCYGCKKRFMRRVIWTVAGRPLCSAGCIRAGLDRWKADKPGGAR